MKLSYTSPTIETLKQNEFAARLKGDTVKEIEAQAIREVFEELLQINNDENKNRNA